MKKLLIAMVGLLLCVSVNAQQLVADFQKKYEKNANFSVVNITAKMFQLIGSMGTDEEQSVIKDLDGLRVITTEKNAKKHYKNALSMVQAADYEELMNTEEENERMVIYMKEEEEIISSLIILTENMQEFSMIGISGNIDLKKLASLSETLNIKKLNKLESVSEE